MKSGWVHDLKLHQFSVPAGPRLIKGKVCAATIVSHSQTLSIFLKCLAMQETISDNKFVHLLLHTG